MNYRPHAAHGGKQESADEGEFLPGESPAVVLQPETEHARAWLEELDDVIFLAIRGDKEALRETRRLWPEVVAAIGWEMVDESREQYLRYTTDILRGLERETPRDPHRALAALEVLELLTANVGS